MKSRLVVLQNAQNLPFNSENAPVAGLHPRPRWGTSVPRPPDLAPHSINPGYATDYHRSLQFCRTQKLCVQKVLYQAECHFILIILCKYQHCTHKGSLYYYASDINNSTKSTITPDLCFVVNHSNAVLSVLQECTYDSLALRRQNQEATTQQLKSGVIIPTKCKLSEIPNTRRICSETFFECLRQMYH